MRAKIRHTEELAKSYQQRTLMSLEKTKYHCQKCGQKFMSDEIRKMHERYCEEDND